MQYSDILMTLKDLFSVASEALHQEYGLDHLALIEHTEVLLNYRFPIMSWPIRLNAWRVSLCANLDLARG